MIHFVERGTTLRANRVDELLVRENPDVSMLGRVFAAIGGTAFIAGGLFFWQIPVESTGIGTDLARIALCSGLGLIGAVIGWSALYPRKSVTQLEVDPGKREVRLGSVKPEADFKVKHRMTFGEIERFCAGSQTSTDVRNVGGSTVLYVEGTSGPRNGATLVGSVHELEKLAREINDMLARPLTSEPASNQHCGIHRSGGFGRRGL